MAATSSVATQLNLPPGYRFVPEDKELVGDYLVPRLLGYAVPTNEILDVDPLSAPPPQLLRAHGRKRGQDAFFFAEGQAKDGRGSRQRRTCAGGGMWQGQTTLVADGTLGVHVPGGGVVVVQWRKKSFNFHEDKSAGSTGWVMHEYAVTAPPDLAASQLRVYRIRCSGHGKNAKKRKRGQALDSDEDEDEDVVPAHARVNNTQDQEQSDVGGGNAATPFVAVGEYQLAAQQPAEPFADPSDSNPPDATDGRAGIAAEVDVQSFLSSLAENAPIVDLPEGYTSRFQDDV